MGLIFKKSTAQPAFTVAAAITGTARVGQTLTCAYTATKARASNVTVRWYSYFDNVGTDQVLIGTGTTYVLTGNELGRYIRAIVTASNPAGTVQSTSSYTAAVTTEVPPDPPTVESAAAITGTLEVGQTLAVFVTFSGADSVAYQWYSYTSAGGAGASALGTSTTQALTVAEDGKYIGCQATGTNASGSTVSTAALVGPIAANASEAPTVVSAATIAPDDGADDYNEGEYLICDAEFSGHTSTPTFAWYKCDAGKANAELLVGAGSTPIQPLPVSRPGYWRGALFLDQSLGLAAAGKSVYCVVTGTNGVGSTPSESAELGTIGVIQGTAVSAADKAADGIIYLTSPNTTYYLSENITFDGPGIALTASNITLNGNNKTITYDNAARPTVVNGGFESGTAGWDFTNAGSTGAAIHTPPGTQAAFVDNQLFEGSSSLRFLDCTGDGYVESTGTVSLAANTTYVLSAAMHYGTGQQPSNPGVRGYVRLLVGGAPIVGRSPTDTGPAGNYWIGPGNATTNKDGKDYADWTAGRTYVVGNFAWRDGTLYRCILGNADSEFDANKWAASSNPSFYYTRGFQRVEMRFTTTDAVSANIRIGVIGHASSTKPYFFDDIKITKLQNYGVVTGISPSTGPPRYLQHDLAYLAGTLNHTVKNIIITQGAGRSTWSPPIFVGSTTGTRIHRVATTSAGDNTASVGTYIMDKADRLMTVEDCTFESNCTSVTSRDNQYGMMMGVVRGEVHRNTFLNGPALGLSIAGYGSTATGNVFRMKNRFTNGFALQAEADTTTFTERGRVYDNVIENGTPPYSGPGIILSIEDEVEVFNNTIAVRLTGNNQEYSTTNAGDYQNGCYGIQLENCKNKIVHDNYVTVGTEFGEAYCLRVGGGGSYLHAPNQVYANTFVALLDEQASTVPAGKADCGCMRVHPFVTSPLDGLEIYENLCIGDDKIFGEFGNQSGLVLRRNRIDARSGNGTLDVYGLYNSLPIDIVFLDNVYVTPAAETLMETKVPPGGSYYIKWTITVVAQDGGAARQPGLTVTITDKNANVVASGTTDATGTFVAEVAESYHQSSGITTYNDHNIAITGAMSGSQSLTADSTQTVTITVS